MGATRLDGGFIDLREIPLPLNPATDVGRLYSRDLAGVTTLFYLDSAGTETDLLGGGAGEANTSSNVGGGEGLAIAKVGVDLPFKSLIGGTNITLSSDGTEITIDATAGEFFGPWTANHVAGDFNLTSMGILEFTDTDTTITQIVGALVYDVAGTFNHDFRVSNTIEYQLGSAQSNWLGNNMVNMGALSFDDVNTSIQQSGGSLQIDVASAATLVLRVDNANEYIFSAVGLEFLDNNLISMGILEFTDTNTTLQQISGALVYDVASGFAHDFRVDNSVEYRFAATIANWFSNDLSGMGILSFADVNTTIQQITGALVYDVDTGFAHDFRVANTIEMRLNATLLDIDAKYIEIESIASPGVTGSATVGRIFMDSGNSNILSVIRNGSVISLEASGGGGDMVLADIQVVTGLKTFNDTRFALRNVADTFSASFVNTISADRIYTLPNAAGTVVITGLSSQITIGTEVTGASTALTDTADIAYLNTANVYTAGTRQDFLGLLAGTSGLNVGGIAGNPTTQVNGDIWLNTSSNTLFGRINGANVDLGAGAGGEVFTWTADHSMATFKLIATAGNNVILNAPTGQSVELEVAGTQEYLFSATALTMNNNTLIMGTGIIQFNATTTTIQQVTNDLQYDTISTGSHIWRINDTPELSLSATVLDLQNNNLALGTGEITVTSQAAGDLLKNDAAGFSRFPRGTPLQVLRVNTGGTDLEYATLGGSGSVRLIKLEGATISTDREGINFADTSTINFTVTDDGGNDESDVIAAIVADSVVDAQIGTHTTTKITTTNKSLLNSAIVYNDQANAYADFDQTFRDNRILINSPDETNPITIINLQQTGARNLTIPILTGNRTLVVIGEVNQLTNTELTSGVFAKITGLGAQSQALDMGTTNKIVNLADPTNPQDAATRKFVLEQVTGLSLKEAVLVATTGNITLSGNQTIDTVLTVNGDRVLVKDQSSGEQNGIYIADAGAWSRSTDADTGTEIEGMACFVQEGTVNDDTGWMLTTDPPITIDVTVLVYVQFTALGQITAGDGLTKTGSTLNVVGTASRIIANADSIDIDAGYVGQASITTLGTIGTGTWTADAITYANLSFSEDIVNADISTSAAIVLTKLQDIATARLLGRETAASGAIEEISLDTSLELVATTTLRRAAITGDITIAAGSNAAVFGVGVIVNADINASAEIDVSKLADGTPGQFIRTDSAGTGVEWTDDIFTINFVIDGGGVVITTGVKGTITVDFACEVLEWVAIADQSGSIVVDVNRSTFSGYPTTVSIAAADLPTISSSTKGENRSVSSWSVIAVGDILEFEVDSITTCQRVTISLVCRKTG